MKLWPILISLLFSCATPQVNVSRQEISMLKLKVSQLEQRIIELEVLVMSESVLKGSSPRE